MQDILLYSRVSQPASFGERRLNSDLARFSLDLSLARILEHKTSDPGPYPSPPMSGSPSRPPPESPYEGRQSTHLRGARRNDFDGEPQEAEDRHHKALEQQQSQQPQQLQQSQQ